jgi:hypothetical protein
MFEFLNQHQAAVALLLALLLAAGCAARYTVHPGALNKTDSAAYDALLIAETTIEEAKRLSVDPKNGGQDVKNASPALAALIKSYNIARESWLTWRGAISSNVAPQEYLDRLNQNLSDLTNASRKFAEAK